MSQLKQFTFNTKDIRVIEKDGQPWFIAKDVAEILEISNARESIRAFPPSEKDVITTDTLGGPQKTTILSEPGLYRLIFQSRKKEAEEFKTWVVSEVLPQIRKTGSYHRELSLEEQALKVITGLTAKVEKQRKEIAIKDLALEEAQPKVEFFDTVAKTNGTCKVGEASKQLNLLSPNKLFERLRNDKIFMQDNIPYQQYIEQGYFGLTMSVKNGITVRTPLVTNKGLIWLEKKYKHLIGTHA